MNRPLMLLCALLPITGLAQEQEPVFSSYSHELKQVSYDHKFSLARFEGTLALDGTLFFEFDAADQGRMDGINFAKFVPSASQIHLLPAVVRGDHAAPIRYLDLPAEEALRAAVGEEEATRLSQGTQPVVSMKARLVIHDFMTDVECDSRTYGVGHFSIVRSPKQQALLTVASDDPALPGGC